MTQEDKELLLRDLCARLPYGLWIDDGYALAIHIDYSDVHFENYFNGILNGDVKPYLRSMSSMTEEEKKELFCLADELRNSFFKAKTSEERLKASSKHHHDCCQLYYSHHLDCGGLIEKGLALEAPEEMYK